MKKKNINNIVMVLSIAFTLINAQTVIVGDISNILFDSTHNPYIVEQDIIIPPESEVVINAGCVLLFKPFAGLSIEGSVYVKGEKDRPVIFTSINDKDSNYIKTPQTTENPVPCDWNGIYIASSSKNIIFDNFILAYSVYSIKSKNEEVRFTNGILQVNGYPITFNDKAVYIPDNRSFNYNKLKEAKLISGDSIGQDEIADSTFSEAFVPQIQERIFEGNSIVNIKTTPSEAIIYIDGELIEGKSPVTIDGVISGKHIIKAVKGPFLNTVAIDAKPNEISNVDIILQEQKTVLKIISNPADAEIFVNSTPGKKIKPDFYSPAIIKDVTFDTVSLFLFKKGYNDTCLRVPILPKVTNTVSVPLIPSTEEVIKNQIRFISNRKKRKIGFIVSLSSLAVAVGGGILTYYADKENDEAIKIKETLEMAMISGEEYEKLKKLNKEKSESAEKKIIAGMGFLGLGGTGLGAGLIFYIPSKKNMNTYGLRSKNK